MTRLDECRYTVADARQRQDSSDYVYEVLRRSKAAGFNQVQQQLNYAYKRFDAELKALLDEPRESTTIDEFLEAVDRKKQA
ncbi:MAG: hypothetical protein M1826_000943 [Phylliscum demangeonii]|nr:MAG: hypothetical protein M1826_000943 [Phylliscum demangeonii]